MIVVIKLFISLCGHTGMSHDRFVGRGAAVLEYLLPRNNCVLFADHIACKVDVLHTEAEARARCNALRYSLPQEVSESHRFRCTNPQNQLYFSSTSGNMFPPFINCQNVLLMGVPVVNEHAVLSFQPPFILKHLSVKKMLKADLKTAWEV